MQTTPDQRSTDAKEGGGVRPEGKFPDTVTTMDLAEGHCSVRRLSGASIKNGNTIVRCQFVFTITADHCVGGA